MKNTLIDLQNHIFEMIENVNDDKFVVQELDQEIRRALAINDLARTAVTNGALMVKAVDSLYGIPVSDDLPLVPKSKGETFLVDNKKKALLSVPREDEGYGYKKGKQQAI